MRLKMKDTGKSSYTPSYQPGELLDSGVVGKVILSKSDQ